jgi:hypothetical protein
LDTESIFTYIETPLRLLGGPGASPALANGQQA